MENKLEKIKALYNLLDDREKVVFKSFLNSCLEQEEKERQGVRQEIVDTLKEMKGKDGSPYFSEEYIEKTFNPIPTPKPTQRGLKL